MDKAAQAEQRIKNICDKLGITEGGRKWVDIALDPFKDIVQKPQGYPDRNMAPSVIQTVHASVDIHSPLATGNWDVNIFLDQIWEKTNLYRTTSFQGAWEQSTQDTVPYCRGGLVVRSGAAGTDLIFTTTQNAACQSLVTDVFDQDTSSRIIGIGMEIHNTTAEIHKQGSIICYKISDDPVDVVMVPYVSGGANLYNPVACKGIELVEPPYNSSQAIDLPGSVQWDASKGAYVVPIFASENNDAQDRRKLIPLVVDDKTGNTFAPQLGANSTQGLVYWTGGFNEKLPTTLSGCYLTGLSAETTLTVNLTYYVEQFPSFDSPMHRVSSPSCPEDFAAIELYTKVAREMPCGVEVNDNFLGSFVSGVSRVMGMVSKYSPQIIQGVSMAANLVGGMFDHGKTADNVTPLASRGPSTYQPNRQSRDVVINEPNNRQIIIHDGGQKLGPSRALQVQQPQIQQQRNRTRTYVKNKRDKDFNRFDRYLKAGNSGSKYIQ